MEGLSKSRAGLMVSAALAALGSKIPIEIAVPFKRGPQRRRRTMRVSNNKYLPRPSPVKNPAVAEQVNAMHDKWLAEQFPSRVSKAEPNPDSISSIKKLHRCTRHVARMMLAAQPSTN